MEDIADADYMHTKRVCKDFVIKNLGEYHDLYVQSDTLLLAHVFENFKNVCLKVYELDPTHLLIAFGLAWQAALKKTKVKLDLLTDNEICQYEICHSIFPKAYNKHIKDYNKNKELSYLNTGM